MGWGVQEVMTHLCTGDQPLLPRSTVLAGATKLLNTMGAQDVVADAPKAADWVSHSSIALQRCCRVLQTEAS